MLIAKQKEHNILYIYIFFFGGGGGLNFFYLIFIVARTAAITELADMMLSGVLKLKALSHLCHHINSFDISVSEYVLWFRGSQ